MLLPQPGADYVRKNLLVLLGCETGIHYYSNIVSLFLGSLFHYFVSAMGKGRFPEIIWSGGSTPSGITGIVSAIFELREQIDLGLMPKPERIYVAAGTMGTTAGILLGLCATGLEATVHAVSILGGKFVDKNKIRCLFVYTNRYLHKNDPRFPLFRFPCDMLEVRYGFAGEGYAYMTPEGKEAIRLVGEHEGVSLERTYTGKTFAALMSDAKDNLPRGEVVLFWNTHNGIVLDSLIEGLDYRKQSSRRRAYALRPLTPPYVRFRIRRFVVSYDLTHNYR